MKTTKIRTMKSAKLMKPVHITVDVDMDAIKYDAEVIGITISVMAGRAWRLAKKITKKAAKLIKEAATFVATKTAENVRYDMEFYPQMAAQLADKWKTETWPALKFDWNLMMLNFELMFDMKIPSINIRDSKLVNRFMQLVNSIRHNSNNCNVNKPLLLTMNIEEM